MARELWWRLTATPIDPSTGSTTTVRISSIGTSDGVNYWKAGIVTPWRLDVDVMSSGRITGASLPKVQDIEIANGDRRWDDILSYQWRDASVLVDVLEVTTGVSFGWRRVFSGTSSGIRSSRSTIRILMNDLRSRFNAPIQRSRFRGFGPAIRANVGDYATPSGTLNLDTTGDLTVECWFRTGSSIGSGFIPAGWHDGGVHPWHVSVNGSGVPTFSHWNTGIDSVAMSGATVTTNTTYHLAVTVNGTSGAVKFYLWDDTNETLYTDTQTLAGATRTTGGVLRLVRSPITTGPTVDFWELRVWSEIRTAEEIEEHRESRLSADDLVTVMRGYWQCDDWSIGGTAPTTLADSSAGGQNADLTAGADTYKWVGSLEGGAAVEGKLRPLGYGYVREAEPVLVDDSRNDDGVLVYYVAEGPLNSIVSVKDGGATLTSGGNIGSGDPYVGSLSFAACDYYTVLSKGLLVLDADPTKTLTVTFEGKTTGGYSADRFTMIQRIATNEGGLAAGDINSLTFTNAASDDVVAATASIGCGFYAGLGQETPLSKALDWLCAPDAWWTVDRTGDLCVYVLPVPEDIVGPTELDASEIGIDPIELIPLPGVPSILKLRYWHHELVQDIGSLVGVAGTELEDQQLLAQEWREVQAMDRQLVGSLSHREEVLNSPIADRLGARAMLKKVWRLYHGSNLTRVRQMYRVSKVESNRMFDWAHSLGDEVTFAADIDAYQLSGFVGVVVGLKDNVSRGVSSMIVWG